MNSPHFLLRSEVTQPDDDVAGGRWRFVLQAAHGERFEAADDEPLAQGERLELLAAVRGLESLDQPSRVILSTASRFVYQGIVQGLEQWRANNWQWERYGDLVPIKHRDLWQRMAQCLAIHQVECRLRGRHLARGCDPNAIAIGESEAPAELAHETTLNGQSGSAGASPSPTTPSSAATPRRRPATRRRWRLDNAHTSQTRGNPACAEWETPGYDSSNSPQELSPLSAAWNSMKELCQSWWRPTRVELAS